MLTRLLVFLFSTRSASEASSELLASGRFAAACLFLASCWTLSFRPDLTLPGVLGPALALVLLFLGVGALRLGLRFGLRWTLRHMEGTNDVKRG